MNRVIKAKFLCEFIRKAHCITDFLKTPSKIDKLIYNLLILTDTLFPITYRQIMLLVL